MIIIKREIKMGYKDVRLGHWNYLQKHKTKCGGRSTFKKIRLNRGVTMCYFHDVVWLGRRSKDIMETRSKCMHDYSITTRGPQFAR